MELFEIKSRFGDFSYYRVDKFGNVYSLKSQSTRHGVTVLRKEPKLLKSFPNTDGYPTVYLYDDNFKRHTIKVHTLIADAFIENPNNYKVINHINEDKTDNRVENLEWCDTRYNNTYNGKAEKIAKLNLKDNRSKRLIAKLDDNNNILELFVSRNSAIRSLGLKGASAIEYAIKHHTKYHGYYWDYRDNLINRSNQQPSLSLDKGDLKVQRLESEPNNNLS